MSKSVWSDTLTAKLSELYKGDNNELSSIAKTLDKSIPAVRSKLVNLKIYQKPETPVKVGGASSTRKTHIVRNIAEAIGMEAEDLESLSKATKPTLEALFEAITVH